MIFSIISIVNFIKKLCFDGEKCPTLFPLLSVACYLVLAISFRNTFYASVVGNKDLLNVETTQLNSITKTGIILTSICALSYYIVSIIKNVLSLQKNQVAKFVTSIVTTVFLIVFFVLLCNSFATAIIGYEGNYVDVGGNITLSFPMASKVLTSIASVMEMLDLVIISGVVQILLICCSFITLFAIIISMNFEKNNIPLIITISLSLLLTAVLSFIALNLLAEYSKIIFAPSIIKHISFDCSIIVITAIISFIPLASSIAKTILQKKAE